MSMINRLGLFPHGVQHSPFPSGKSRDWRRIRAFPRGSFIFPLVNHVVGELKFNYIKLRNAFTPSKK
jgi:hypothetical protein